MNEMRKKIVNAMRFDRSCVYINKNFQIPIDINKSASITEIMELFF